MVTPGSFARTTISPTSRGPSLRPSSPAIQDSNSSVGFQRVSIARCLVYKPKLILMDEPLGALDKKLRLQLQLEIKRIHDELGVTILYVTHDQEEALVLSDRICVMNNARIEQTGTPHELYFHPRNEFVADFLGESNLIAGQVEAVADGIAQVRTDDGARLRALAPDQCVPHSRIKILLRPEAVQISRQALARGSCAPEGREHGLNGIVQGRIFAGQATKYVVAAGNLRIVAQLNSSSRGQAFAPGEQVFVDWSENDSTVLSP
jgi:putative spermidine/putrescine transport system ATP-binding protein